jgi:carbon-monoxide dehydrogenase medium subunit
MKAAAFDYARATDVAHALDLLARYGEGARLIAGGQSLVPALNMRLVAPEILIDIGGIGSLRRFERLDGGLRMGALVRHVDLLNSPLVAEHCPLVQEAVRHVAHPAIRNRGTIGGNLANADPASELPACMLALDATLVATGPGGDRRIAAADFFQGIYATDLRDGEVLTAVEIPAPGARRRSAFLELARRHGDYALAGVACTGEQAADDTVATLRIACFAVADRPLLAHAAADVLLGQVPTAARVAEACRALAGEIEPMGDEETSAAMRLHLATVLAGRALATMFALPSPPSAS